MLKLLLYDAGLKVHDGWNHRYLVALNLNSVWRGPLQTRTGKCLDTDVSARKGPRGMHGCNREVVKQRGKDEHKGANMNTKGQALAPTGKDEHERVGEAGGKSAKREGVVKKVQA